MERFVALIVAGGLAVVAGLWVVTLLETWSSPWLLGITLVVLGAAGLGTGIRSRIRV